MRMVRDEYPVSRQYIFSDINRTNAGDVIHMADHTPVPDGEAGNHGLVFLYSQKKSVLVDDDVCPDMNIVDIPQPHGRNDF